MCARGTAGSTTPAADRRADIVPATVRVVVQAGGIFLGPIMRTTIVIMFEDLKVSVKRASRVIVLTGGPVSVHAQERREELHSPVLRSDREVAVEENVPERG